MRAFESRVLEECMHMNAEGVTKTNSRKENLWETLLAKKIRWTTETCVLKLLFDDWVRLNDFYKGGWIKDKAEV
jgi:hypothetical protein